MTVINDHIFIVIAGNIGSGKTTLTKKLANALGMKAHLEPVLNNPFLADFYTNMSRWSFALQVYFLNHRFNAHRMIEVSNGHGVQDRSIYEDAHVFARALFEQGDMQDREYESYLHLFHSMLKYLSVPSLVVFLNRSVQKLMERIRERNRDYEKSITVDYLSKLNNYYCEWFSSYNLGPSLLVETDDLDLLNNDAHFSDLTENIMRRLRQQNINYVLSSEEKVVQI